MTLPALDTFAFWSLKTINGGGGRHARGTLRRYECRIVHDHHVYTGTGKTVEAAVSVAIGKAETGQAKGFPKLRLVGGVP